MESKILHEAIRSVQDPILKFIETGIFANPYADPDIPEEVRDSKGFISDVQTRRVCRAVAQELKRPFITMTPVIRRYKYMNVGTNGEHRWAYEKIEPQFDRAHIEMPKRKYLMPLVTPLLLAAGPMGTAVSDRSIVGNWVFHINDEQLWNDYRASLDRPEMRAARKLSPLPE